MKLNENFIIHQTERETVLVPVGGSGFAGLVRGNATLGAILSLLREDTDAKAIVAALRQIYDAPAETLTRDVERALAELRAIGALDE